MFRDNYKAFTPCHAAQSCNYDDLLTLNAHPNLSLSYSGARTFSLLGRRGSLGIAHITNSTAAVDLGVSQHCDHVSSISLHTLPYPLV